MYRYVALLCGESDESAMVTAAIRSALLLQPGWREAWASKSICVIHRPSGGMDAELLPNKSGVLLGRSFARNSSRAPLDLSELADKRWGSFVAFAQGCASDACEIYRDPTGGLPCWHGRVGGASLFFCDIEDVRRWLPAKMCLDERFLRGFALLPGLPRSIGGLENISQVRAAELVRLSRRGRKSRFAWTPWRFAADRSILTFDEGTALIRDAVLSTVTSLADGRERLLHSIGGLDSSIVLGALRATSGAALDIIAFNGFTDSAPGDERSYARAAADRAGVTFVPIRLDARRVNLDCLSRWSHQPSPVAFFDVTAPAADIYQLADEIGACSIWTGVGGDNVFFQLPHILPAIDLARTSSNPAEWLTVALDAARYGGESLRHVLCAMTRERLLRTDVPNDLRDLFAPRARFPFLSPDVIAAGLPDGYLHPLLETAADIGKAKQFHVWVSALLSLDHRDPWRPSQRSETPERVAPLLAQPVVEACLRVPAWLLVRGGMDRSMARYAFRDLMPQSVLRRTSKSNPNRLYADVTRANMHLIRSTLLDGTLSRMGILNRTAIEQKLRIDGIFSSDVIDSALDLFSWEIWSSSW
jgi:asparagine synthase (glutamine-hydrolysing)